MHIRKVITFTHGPRIRKLQIWDLNLDHLTIKHTFLTSTSSEARNIQSWTEPFVTETTAII